jgi:hypothetical protein
MERLKPLNDYLFQKLLGEKGDEEQLLSFLNAVLKRTGKNILQSVEILENKTFTPTLEIHFINMVKFRAVKEKDIKNDYLER